MCGIDINPKLMHQQKECQAPKVRFETKGMNNPRTSKKGHEGDEMLLVSEEKG